MGAVASGGVRVLDESVIGYLGIPESVVDSVAERALAEMRRREMAYRDDRPPIDVAGRTAILVDDGLATGSTMRAAAEALRGHGPARIVVAVPVASVDACRYLGEIVDEVVCCATPNPFYAVGAWYHDFGQTSDDEVRELLARAAVPEAEMRAP